VIRSNLHAATGLLIVLSGLAAGCQWLGQGMTQSDRLAEKRRERADAFARSIDQQHEQADLVAARDLWQRGDHESCKRRLNEILTRNPEQLDARLLLAEVFLDENQAQEGIRVLKPAEAAHHDDARVQYTMGLLLDASGSQEGARSHYQAAARLEPGNEVYTVSYNEAITTAKGNAAPDNGESKDLKQYDPSVPPPPPDDAVGQANAGVRQP
jgi:tetratricopeptide (TPR) repeat protein